MGRARRTLIGEVRRALDSHRSAVEQRTYAESRVADDETSLDERRVALRSAVTAFDAEAEAYVTEVQGWARSCIAVDPVRIAAALGAPLTNPALVAAGIASLRAQLQSEYAVARRDVTSARSTAEAEREVLVAERESLDDGRLIEPPAPPWRTDRGDRAGAPLWRLVDLAAGTAAREADGLEAALVASGLLDAWVAPDGSLDLAADRSDGVLTTRPVAGRSLAEVLVPLDGAAVDSAVIAGVLASMAVAETVIGMDGGGPEVARAEVIAGLDGTFSVGAAVGRGSVRPAELIGAEARTATSSAPHGTRRRHFRLGRSHG